MVVKPLDSPESITAPAMSKPVTPTPGGTLKTEPKGIKLAYSDRALAELQGMPAAEPARPEIPQPGTARPEATKPESAAAPAAPDHVDWGWPTTGKPASAFSDATPGIDIPGKAGQPVTAAAAGKVIHADSKLRGYGKLVIIQHNSMYLSAYAYNQKLLVKEGDQVKKGQPIAEMGSTDSDRVQLHFEIRRYGKPVDPLKFLPPR